MCDDADIKTESEYCAAISEAIEENDEFRTEYLLNELYVKVVLQDSQSSRFRAWLIEELMHYDPGKVLVSKYLLSHIQNSWSSFSEVEQEKVLDYCSKHIWKSTDDPLFNQVAAEIIEGKYLN